MDSRLNSETVKSLRLKKSWSQEHLASLSGISLRTMQRIENSGAASFESKLSISAALGVPIEYLSGKPAKAIISKHTILYGYYGAGLGLMCSYAGTTLALTNGSLSYGQAGVWYGAVGAFVGLCCGIIGILGRRAGLT